MSKKIIICADGTWNKPTIDTENETVTNVLQFARGIAPMSGNIKQVVFYDWGIGSYHDNLTGGGLGAGLEKNVMDGYRFLVHNYQQGDEIYLFGFSRGAYTVRSLCGMINNCHILKGVNAGKIEKAFEFYKNPDVKPSSAEAEQWRAQNSVPNSGTIKFIGVWDTVGAMGLPFSFFGLIKDSHQFYDCKLGGNIEVARHALSLDEKRDDFEPTIWHPNHATNLKQVWFAGVHSDVGGGYLPDSNGHQLSDIAAQWMKQEAEAHGLAFEPYFKYGNISHTAAMNKSYKGFMRFLGKYKREIPVKEDDRHPDFGKPEDRVPYVETFVHSSVKKRYEQSNYTNQAIERYVQEVGQWPELTD